MLCQSLVALAMTYPILYPSKDLTPSQWYNISFLQLGWYQSHYSVTGAMYVNNMPELLRDR